MQQARPLCTAKELDLVKTFECGQCFRWNCENGIYSGTALGRAVRLWERDGLVYITSSEEEITALWRRYFDLELDYGSLFRDFDGGEYFAECLRFGEGIRILRQEPWETLCSFIISQCNNIPRIKGIVERLCLEFGDRLEGGEFSFPAAERIAELDEQALSPLRCGYRARYILSAARRVASGELDLAALEGQPFETALAALKSLEGVGDKVANCVILFGLHDMSAFPIDVWMKRALKEHFPPEFDPKSFGEYAGLAQQYIFHYIRSNG